MNKRTIAAFAAVTLALAVTQSCYAQTRNASGPGRWVVQPPANGVYTGVHAGPNSNERSCAGVSRAIGRVVQLCEGYYAIRTLPRIVSDLKTTELSSAGSIPVVSLGCAVGGRMMQGGPVSYSDIAAGAEDSYLAGDAEALKAYAAKYPQNPWVMIRPFHEFNLNIGNPRGNPNGNNCYSAGSVDGMQSEFKDAFRHVVTFMASHGVTNVTWLWCPAVGPGVWHKYGGADLLRGFYPGDQYVDWTCADAYDKAPGGGGTANAFQYMGVFKQFNKPAIIAETGECNSEDVSPRCSGYVHTQAQYIAEMEKALQPGGALAAFGVKAWMYFDQSVRKSGYNWSFDRNGLSAFAQMVNTPYFHPAMPPPRWVPMP